jgi:nucleotidyltransferase substrate binding protein (TIGR01987 family)
MPKNELHSSSSFINFKRALANLRRSLATPIQEPRDRSGIIKDFEMTYELSWKVLKKLLKTQGHETLGAKDVFTKAFQLGYIQDESAWFKMIEDRTQTSHVYDEAEAQTIVSRIKDKFEALFVSLEKRAPTIRESRGLAAKMG